MKDQPFNRRRGWSTFISVFCFLLGVSLLLYPTLSRVYADYKLNQLIEQWEPGQTDSSDQTQRMIEEYVSLQHVFTAERDSSYLTEQYTVQSVNPDHTGGTHSLQVEASTSDRADEQSSKRQKAEAIQPISMLHIEKIGLQLPVVNGATQSNLKYAAARIEGTGQLGEVGNAAIAAHRSLTYGKFFNRLNELVVGDRILVETDDQQIEYEVFRIHVVEPTDLSVLNRNDTDRILTLITCDPIEEATHRLVVHAVVKE
jgi:sortase A